MSNKRNEIIRQIFSADEWKSFHELKGKLAVTHNLPHFYRGPRLIIVGRRMIGIPNTKWNDSEKDLILLGRGNKGLIEYQNQFYNYYDELDLAVGLIVQVSSRPVLGECFVEPDGSLDHEKAYFQQPHYQVLVNEKGSSHLIWFPYVCVTPVNDREAAKRFIKKTEDTRDDFGRNRYSQLPRL